MRVLVLTSTFPRWAGDPQPPFVLELCKRLSAAQHDVLVLAPHCRGAALAETLGERLAVRRFRYAPQALELLAYDGGILENLRRARWRYLLIPLFLLAEWWAAARAIRRELPDVIHAHWIVPQGAVALLARLAAPAAKRPAVVCTSHGSDLLGLSGGLATTIKAAVLRRAAGVSVVSAAMKARAVAIGVPAGKVRVMPMGVDALERFTPRPGRERAAAEILFVGRLVKTKGVAHLFEAFVETRAAAPDARLVVVGAGPEAGPLSAWVAARGLQDAVTFAGAVPNAELAPYYRRASVLVAPSVGHEGFGLVLAEALACECPVIASDLPGIADIVEDGVTGLLARPGDARDIADKIGALLRDPSRAQGLARQGRSRVLERFDWTSVARGYAQLLSAASGVA